MPAFLVPYVADNPTSWGPPMNDGEQQDTDDDANPNAPPKSKFALLPYAPFGRGDRLGRVADFTSRYQGYERRDNTYNRGGAGGGGGARRADDNQEFQYKVDAKEQSSFQLVDTSKTQVSGRGGRFVTPAARRRQHTTRLRQINARRQQSLTGPNLHSQKTRGGGGGGGGASSYNAGGGRGGGGGGGGGGFGRGVGRGGGGGRGGRGYGRGGRAFQQRVDRQASVSVQSDWKQVEELDLHKLTKNMTASTAVPVPQDVLWCGFLEAYNDSYDKVTARAPVSLKRTETKEFYPVTTTDDPVLEKLAIDQVANVFITDAILSHIMTCTRSVYPWDIVIQKLPNGTLFFDKRDNSSFDYLTVHETSYNPPTNENKEDTINTPERLALEATMVHQNFSQQILKRNTRQDMDLPNPFFDEDDNEDNMEPAAVAYRYRTFDLDNGIVLCCRTELHGVVVTKSSTKNHQYMTCFCLNEYVSSSLSWRDKMDTQFGAVLANELKNNSFQLAKWTVQSILAGADQMKIGFVSRTSPKNAYEHEILTTQFYRPKDFSQQINVSQEQMWSMIRFFIGLMQKQPQGKYVLLRDPNKAIVRLYSVPPETFEEDE